MHSQPGSSLTPLTQGLPARTRAAVEIIGLLLVVAVVGLAMNNLGLFATEKLDRFFNDWVHCGVEVLAATLVLARALLVRQERGAWLMLALGVGFYAAGDIYSVGGVQGGRGS